MKTETSTDFPSYEVLNALIEAAKRNQRAVNEATQALRDAIEMFDTKAPFPHYDVLNGLIEAAKRNQGAVRGTAQALATSITKLDARTSNLPGTLLEPVANKLLPRFREEFAAVTEDAQRARDELQRVARTSVWKFFLTPSICFAFAVVVLSIWLYFTVPRPGQLESLQSEKLRLEDVVARLEAKGGKADLTTCGPKRRVCVRTDDSQGVFGDGSKSYRIVYGY